VGRTVRRAAKILTGTEVARASILKVYGDAGRRQGSGGAVRARLGVPAVAREAAVAAVEKRHSLAGPFILSVGDIQPRKNHIGLIKAFAKTGEGAPAVEAQAGAGG